MSDGSPCAVVQYWFHSELDSYIYAKCPYCERSHRHNLEAPSSTGQTRIFECGPDADYRLLFPYELHVQASALGWELDKPLGGIYTVSSKGRIYEPDVSPDRKVVPNTNRALIFDYDDEDSDDNDCADQREKEVDEFQRSFRNMGISDQGAEHTTSRLQDVQIPGKTGTCLDSPRSRRLAYIKACLKTDIQRLATLFDTYNDDFVTMHDKDHSNGILIAARSEAAVEAIEFLRHKGVTADTDNIYGRTPLMEAALWGRLDTVKYLLGHGADVARRDGLSLTALSLCTDTERNRAELLDRCEIYQETAAAPRDRKVIETMLRRKQGLPLPRDTTETPAPQLAGFFKFFPDNIFAYFDATAIYRSPNVGQGKAFGLLDRGPQYQRQCAMSGYSHASWPDVLDNQRWTAEVLRLCKILGFPVEMTDASHVEKQLIAFYVDKHILLPGDNFVGKGLVGPVSSVTARRQAIMGAWLDELEGHRPPCRIIISKRVTCHDCQTFFKLVRQKLDLVVEVICAV